MTLLEREEFKLIMADRAGKTCFKRVVALFILISFMFYISLNVHERVLVHVERKPFMIRQRFWANNLLFRNGTLRLLGKYVEKEDAVSSHPTDVLLEIDNVSRLIVALLQKQRDRSIKRKYENNFMAIPPKLNGTSTYDFNVSTLYKQKDTTDYNSPSYDGDMVYPDMKYFITDRTVKDVNCAKLFRGNKGEVQRAKALFEEPRKRSSSLKYLTDTRNCSLYIEEAGYINTPLTMDEENFPIAYSILVFKSVYQFEKLLRSIYRPQNHYCVHVDKTSSTELFDAISGVVNCFENVFMSSERFNVSWGKYTILEPEFTCMIQLLRHKNWKYFINLTGQEFPLRTNSELVRILRSLNGANDVEGTVIRADPSRWVNAGTPPDGITPVKGAVHITVNREFVEYVVNNPVAQRFKEWVKKVDFPDEVYFSSLNHNPQLGIPGSYKGEPETNHITKPFLSRFKNWGSSPNNWTCGGQRVRMLCVFGVEDLPLLSSRVEFFANKFYIDYEPATLECMEELHYNRTRDEYLSQLEFDAKFYEMLNFTKHIVPSKAVPR